MKLKPINYPTLKALQRKAVNVPFVETPIASMEITKLQTRVEGTTKVISVFIGKSWPEKHDFLLNERGYDLAKNLLEAKTLDYIREMVKHWTDWVDFGKED